MPYDNKSPSILYNLPVGDKQSFAGNAEVRPSGGVLDIVEVDCNLIDRPICAGQAIEPDDRGVGGKAVTGDRDPYVACEQEPLRIVDRPSRAMESYQVDVTCQRFNRQDRTAEPVAGDRDRSLSGGWCRRDQNGEERSSSEHPSDRRARITSARYVR